MILVNSLTTVPSDPKHRIYLRNHFSSAGFQSNILPKLEALDYNLLNMQIQAFKEAAENDLDVEFGDKITEYTDINQPMDLFNHLLENVADSSKSVDYLVSIMKCLLWIKGDPETK
jgi:hypothetical protein